MPYDYRKTMPVPQPRPSQISRKKAGGRTVPAPAPREQSTLNPKGIGKP